MPSRETISVLMSEDWHPGYMFYRSTLEIILLVNKNLFINKMKSCITFLLCLIGFNLVAQNNSYDCSKEPNDFNFWLGNWQLTWNDTVHGTNNIFRENSCVIHENFI